MTEEIQTLRAPYPHPSAVAQHGSILENGEPQETLFHWEIQEVQVTKHAMIWSTVDTVRTFSS